MDVKLGPLLKMTKTKWEPSRGRFLEGYMSQLMIMETGEPDTIKNYINYSVTLTLSSKLKQEEFMFIERMNVIPAEN
jgi:hypothetical protein